MAKAGGTKDATSKYVTLRTYGKRKVFVMFVTIAASIFFGVVFNTSVFRDGEEMSGGVVAAIVVTCFAMIFLPLTEEWQYTPWQDACQKCEKDTYD